MINYGIFDGVVQINRKGLGIALHLVCLCGLVAYLVSLKAALLTLCGLGLLIYAQNRIAAIDLVAGKHPTVVRPSFSDPLTPLFPGYCAREGHGATWHYRGYLRDTLRVWSTFAWLVARHPLVTFRGLRMFYIEIIYRLPFISDRNARVLVFLACPVAIAGPVILLPLTFLMTVLPVPKPRMFRPFTVVGLMNYCAMLVIVSVFHTNARLANQVSPKLSRQYASKLYWREFFSQHLQSPSTIPELYATVTNSRIEGAIPQSPFVVKPESAGAGYKLYAFEWDARNERYLAKETYFTNGQQSYSKQELHEWLKSTYRSALVESWEESRKDLPTSSLRVLTVRFGKQAELLSLVLLVAPKDSLSTAHAGVHPYLIDAASSRVAWPCLDSFEEQSEVCNTEIPELHSIIKECVRMHEQLPLGQIEVSWDIILTEAGPVYLEGNIIPPGCDYKLMVFENRQNLNYFLGRYMRMLTNNSAAKVNN